MGHNKSKMQGLVLPCQSGKTGRAINIIRERYEFVSKLHGCETDVNIWISANNKLLVKQTESRMTSELCEQESEYDEKSEADDSDEEADADAVIKGDVFSWMAGSKKNNISVSDLTLAIITDDVEMIVMCSNGIRIRYLNQMLESLHKLYLRGKFQKKINIWIDEADKSVSTWSKYPNVLEMGMINQVIMVTATVESIVKKYHSIRVMRYETTYPECYRRMKDMECFEVDYAASDVVGYIRHIMDARPTLVQPGVRAFIPGKADKQSHEDIATYLMSIGFVVIILNGTHKEMRLPEGDVIDLRPYLTVSEFSNPDEFSVVLSRMYVENRLDRYPLAITGFICIERGITFQCPPSENHNGFLFDYGIIPPIPNKAEAYQAMARLFGNIGHFPNYKPCKIYTTAATFKKVQNQEEIAVNLARMMYESGQDEATIATLKDAANFEEEKDFDLTTLLFTTLADANAHLKKHGFNQTKMESFERDPVDERFVLSSLTQKKERLSYEEVKRIQLGWTKTSGWDKATIKSGRARRMFVCYKNMEDPTSIVFLVRIFTQKHE